MKTLAEYWELLSKYLKPQKLLVLALGIALGANIGLQLFTPRILRDFIDMTLAGTGYQELARKALLFFVTVLLAQLAAILSTFLSEQLAWRSTNLLRVDLAAHCLRMDMGFHQIHPPGTLIERVEGDVEALSNFFSQFVVRLGANVLLVAGVLILLAREDWRAGAGLAVFAGLAIYAMMRIRRVGVPRWVALRQKSAEAYGFLGEMLQGTEDIQSSGASHHIVRRFDGILKSWLPLRRKAMLAFSLMWTTSLLLFSLGTAFAFGLGYALWSAGTITAGTVYLIFNYTELIRQPIEQIRAQLEDLQKASAGIARVREILTMEPAVRDGSGVSFPQGALDVRFRKVTFAYHGQETALQDIDFHLPPGKVLGLLGRTGSGKSTMARLLLRLYDVDSGEICLGGEGIASARLAQITRQVGLVPQEIQIFRATVRENLAVFMPEISDDRILECVREFGLSSWFKSLPRGLDTELSGAGGLSAGQAQLLNFARVALREPSLVILDEATSRLDPATELLVDRATRRLLANRTGIVIAHRLHTVQRADLIMILESGRIMEYGVRDELLRDPASRFSSLMKLGLEEVLR